MDDLPGRSIGEWIVAERERRAWSRADLLGALADQGHLIDMETLGRIERGETRRPQEATLRALFGAFDLAEGRRQRWRAAAARPDGRSAPCGAALIPPPRLATPPDSFVGRAALLASTRAARLDPTARVVALLGAGGVGKTRLAYTAANALREEFDGLVYAVELADLPDPAEMPQAILRRIAVRQGARGEPLTLLTALLRDRRLLLVLDNFETVRGAEATLAALVAACPRLIVLVTSQHRLALHRVAVRALDVPPLAVPARDAHDRTLDRLLAESPATALLVERARAARPDLALGDADAPALAAITRRLEGLPLAIEIVAARLRTLPLGDMAADLARRIPLDWVGEGDRETRQRTLRAAIAFSHDRLDNPHARALYPLLAVLVGGGTLAAIRALAGADEAGAGAGAALDTADALHALAEASLVRAAHGMGGMGGGLRADGEARYRLLEPVRADAAERLARAGLAEVARARHAAHFLSPGEPTRVHLGGHLEGWLRRLDPGRDNLDAALAWARDRGEHRLLARATAALWPYWHERGLLLEGLAWLDVALADRARLPDPLHAALLAGQMWMVFDAGEYARARELGVEALRLCRAVGDLVGQAMVLSCRGTLEMNVGAFPAAYAAFRECLACWRALDDERGVAQALNDLALLLTNYGRLDEAAPLLDEALALYRRDGNRLGESRVWTERGAAALVRGDLALAGDHFARALALVRPTLNRLHLGFVLTYLGVTETLGGALDAGWGHLTEALYIRRDEHDLHGIGYDLLALAAVANRREQPTRAARLCGAGLGCLAAMGATMIPTLRALYEHDLAILKGKCSPADFAADFAAGGALSLEGAIDYALQAPVPG